MAIPACLRQLRLAAFDSPLIGDFVTGLRASSRLGMVKGIRAEPAEVQSVLLHDIRPHMQDLSQGALP